MIDIRQLKDNISRKLNSVTEKPAPVVVAKETAIEHPVNTATIVKEHNQPMAIGATIHIKGDVTGDEDLIIHGHVEGRVNLKDYQVTIGPKGSVKANIHARQVVIEGQLNGDIKGEEKVIIRKTGNVLGNVISPRVTLEDGAMFKGSIEMEPRDMKNSATKLDTNIIKTHVN